MRSSQNEPPVAVVADDRERSPEVIQYLHAIPGVAVGIERLAAGDYLADRRLLFERKTLRDLSISIVDGRLFRQMGALAKTRNKAVLILEGTAKDAENGGCAAKPCRARSSRSACYWGSRSCGRCRRRKPPG